MTNSSAASGVLKIDANTGTVEIIGKDRDGEVMILYLLYLSANGNESCDDTLYSGFQL